MEGGGARAVGKGRVEGATVARGARARVVVVATVVKVAVERAQVAMVAAWAREWYPAARAAADSDAAMEALERAVADWAKAVWAAVAVAAMEAAAMVWAARAMAGEAMAAATGVREAAVRETAAVEMVVAGAKAAEAVQVAVAGLVVL